MTRSPEFPVPGITTTRSARGTDACRGHRYGIRSRRSRHPRTTRQAGVPATDAPHSMGAAQGQLHLLAFPAFLMFVAPDSPGFACPLLVQLLSSSGIIRHFPHCTVSATIPNGEKGMRKSGAFERRCGCSKTGQVVAIGRVARPCSRRRYGRGDYCPCSGMRPSTTVPATAIRRRMSAASSGRNRPVSSVCLSVVPGFHR